MKKLFFRFVRWKVWKFYIEQSQSWFSSEAPMRCFLTKPASKGWHRGNDWTRIVREKKARKLFEPSNYSSITLLWSQGISLWKPLISSSVSWAWRHWKILPPKVYPHQSSILIKQTSILGLNARLGWHEKCSNLLKFRLTFSHYAPASSHIKTTEILT
jgi:hypothetical protein